MPMPQIQSAFNGWETIIKLINITQVNDDYENKPIESKPIIFKGVVQPLSPRELMLKPEGDRQWKWLDIHVRKSRTNLALNNGDIVLYKNSYYPKVTRYKIMKVNDWTLDNYIEYHLVEDFTDENDG